MAWRLKSSVGPNSSAPAPDAGYIPLTIHQPQDNLLDEGDFDQIVEQSLPSGSLKANPKKIEPEDVRELLAAVL